MLSTVSFLGTSGGTSFWRGSLNRDGRLLPNVDPRATATAGKREMKDVGWTDELELSRVARRIGRSSLCAIYLHKAPSLPKDQSRAGGGEGTDGRETETREIIYVKLYKAQIPVVERAIETAPLMPGQVTRLLPGDDLSRLSGQEQISTTRTQRCSCSSCHDSSNSPS
jgi:hypothetical protein